MWQHITWCVLALLKSALQTCSICRPSVKLTPCFPFSCSAQLALAPALAHQDQPGPEYWAAGAALVTALLWPLLHRPSWRRWRPAVLACVPVLLAWVVLTDATFV